MQDLFYHDNSEIYYADEKDVCWAEMEIIMTRDNNIPEIDFVITWVDGNDPDWQKQKMEYSIQPDLSQKQDDRKERYRDWDLLRYWFRGVERFAPWVRRIHFVTWGHLPSWLNKEHPKLNIVNHKDFIPEKYLPTFNSHAIEWNMHRIPGLAENFVYFNDDMFLIKKVRPEQYFKMIFRWICWLFSLMWQIQKIRSCHIFT